MDIVVWNVVLKASGSLFTQSHPVSKLPYNKRKYDYMELPILLSCLKCHLSLMGAFCSLCPPTKRKLWRDLGGGFLGGSMVKNLPVNAGDTGDVVSIPGLKRSPGRGNGNPLQYSCLENPKDRKAWQAIVHRVPNSRTQLSD